MLPDHTGRAAVIDMNIKRGLKWMAGVGGLALLTLGISSWLAPRVVRGPYLQQSTPTSVILRWRTSRPVNTTVRYGLKPDGLLQSCQARMRSTDHGILLSNLVPATRYYYAVEGAPSRRSDANQACSFVTPPPPGTAAPTRIWVLGDSGTGEPDQRAVRDAFYRFAQDRPADLCLLLGDNAYGGGTDAQYQNYFFDAYRKVLSQISFWPAIGNHDTRSAEAATQTGVYFDVFNLPTQAQGGGVMSGTESYYSFDYANLHLICLDSEGSARAADGPMLSWLRDDLGQNRQTWTIAYWHQPPYTRGSHDSDEGAPMREMRENVVPMLEEAGVDLVLGGHSHTYERSFLLDGHYGPASTFSKAMLRSPGNGRPDGAGAYRKPADPRTPHAGTVYAVAGSSGHNSHLQPSPHPAMSVSLNVAGSLVIDVAGPHLEAVFLDGAGAIQDRFAITKNL